MNFKHAFRVFAPTMALASTLTLPALADILITDPKQLQNLTVEEIKGEGGAKYHQLSIIYKLADGSLGQAQVTCTGKPNCTKLKGEITNAVNSGKAVLLNFDNQQTVAKILDKPAADMPVDNTKKVVCNESSPSLVAEQAIGFSVNVLQDVSIPANSTSTRLLNSSCNLNLREAWAQPRNLKSRNISAFVDKAGIRTSYTNIVTGQTSPGLCYAGDTPHEGHCHEGPDTKGNQYDAPPIYYSITFTTPMDKTVQSVTCVYSRESKEFDADIKGRNLGFWNKLLTSKDQTESSIGKAEACTKPVEAFLIGDEKERVEGLALFVGSKDKKKKPPQQVSKAAVATLDEDARVKTGARAPAPYAPGANADTSDVQIAL